MHVSDALLLALAALPTAQASLYTKKSPVLQVDSKSYQSLIAKSNHTSIVEFYAPWCGHCKNLAPAYQKAALRLSGLANVAAVNCDEESNKPFCGSMGVQGFPTLKIVKPGKKKGKPSVQDYQGGRTAKDIVEAIESKIPNHVTKVKDDNLETWLKIESARPKALIVGEKGLIPALAKAIAIDFLGAIDIGYARSSDKAITKKYEVSKFPSVVLIQEQEDVVKYDGEVEKGALLDFLSQAAPANPGALKPKLTGKESSAKSSHEGKRKEGKKTSKKEGKKSNTKSKSAATPDGHGEGGDPASCPHAKGQKKHEEL